MLFPTFSHTLNGKKAVKSLLNSSSQEERKDSPQNILSVVIQQADVWPALHHQIKCHHLERLALLHSLPLDGLLQNKLAIGPSPSQLAKFDQRMMEGGSGDLGFKWLHEENSVREAGYTFERRIDQVLVVSLSIAEAALLTFCGILNQRDNPKQWCM